VEKTPDNALPLGAVQSAVVRYLQSFIRFTRAIVGQLSTFFKASLAGQALKLEVSLAEL